MLIDQLSNRRLFVQLVAGAMLATILFGFLDSRTVLSQEADDVAGPAPAAGDTEGSDEEVAVSEDAAVPGTDQPGRINLFKLILQGGMLMIPIAIMSVLVATFGIERGIGLRRYRVMPNTLVEELGRLANAPGGFDPRKAYRACQKYPSAAATVIRAMLLKIGRPHSEVEHAVKEASEREAERLYGNVRWLSLAAAVAPLMGLLGTVWGMIQAFFDTTQLTAGQNKADFLAEGIYVALVTTLGGLAVAIPAAILAHYFEGRIQTLFHQIDEMLFNIMPQIERYEGRLRVSQSQLGDAPSADGTAKPAQSPPAEKTKPMEPAAATK